MLHKAIIAGLTMDPESNTPIIILKSEKTDQAVPIWIGLLEATSIASALKKVNFDRPMTHDLFKNLSEQMDIIVSKVEICDLRNNTYYAQIHFLSMDATFSIDARPSDAIAIALRFDAPIFLDDRVIEKSQIPMGDKTDIADESEDGKKWADYLENLDPEDFGKV